VTGAWQTRWAPTGAELAACVECGLCLPHCPTFRLTGDEAASPRGRLNAMSAVASGVLDIDEAFDEVMSFCLQCRACEAACPSLVPFGRAMEGARAELAIARPTPGRRLRHVLLGSWLPRRGLMRVVTVMIGVAQRLGAGRWLPGRLGSGLRGLRRLPLRGRSPVSRADGDEPTAPSIGLLRGCVMGPWFGGVHEATVAVLRAAGYRVIIPAGQTCCGALAAHEGAADRAARLAGSNVGAFVDVDVVVANAAGCTAHLRGYDHWAEGGADLANRTSDVVEVVAEAIERGRLPRLDPGRGIVAVQDPCHHRHALRIVRPTRTIIEAAGHAVVEIDPDGMCCGAAGVYSLLRPGASSELGRLKAAQVRATGAALVASANPGCEMQLRSYLGSDVRVAHPVEIYAEAAGFVDEVGVT
jgi:glycolate oxidase iron-sulfur subunit